MEEFKMRHLGLMLVTIILISISEVRAQSSADSVAIKQTALNYIEGWYEGNAERMEKALHPELAKRCLRVDPKTGKTFLDQVSGLNLVQRTRAGGGKQTPTHRQQKDITILDAFEKAASVKIVASDWVDYLHMVKWNGEWKIINVLWELKPETR
jgi:Putative lumazine-binding